jgi:hypothetical protein
VKNYFFALLTAVIGIFGPVKEVMATVVVLILLDLVTGMYAAYKRKEPLSSSAIRRTVSKIFIYEVAIGAGFLAQAYLVKDLIPVANLIGSVVGLVELKSVLENLNGASGTDIFKSIIDRLGSDNKTPPQA